MALLYLFWPLMIGSKTVKGHEHYSVLGIVLLVIWLPIAIGVPLYVSQRPRLKAKREAERAERARHIATMEHELGMQDERSASLTGGMATPTPYGTGTFTRTPGDLIGSVDLANAIRDAKSMVIDALQDIDACGKRQFEAMSAWPLEGPYSPDQIAKAQELSRQSEAESEELSAVLDLRTRRLEGLLAQARAEGMDVHDERFIQESGALKQSIRDSNRRIGALAQLFRSDVDKNE